MFPVFSMLPAFPIFPALPVFPASPATTRRNTSAMAVKWGVTPLIDARIVRHSPLCIAFPGSSPFPAAVPVPGLPPAGISLPALSPADVLVPASSRDWILPVPALSPSGNSLPALSPMAVPSGNRIPVIAATEVSNASAVSTKNTDDSPQPPCCATPRRCRIIPAEGVVSSNAPTSTARDSPAPMRSAASVRAFSKLVQRLA